MISLSLLILITTIHFTHTTKVINLGVPCPTNKSCSPSQLLEYSKRNRVKIMRMHNFFRSRIATAENLGDSTLPSASNMLELRYSMNQEKTAICLLHHCTTEHNLDIIDELNVRVGYTIYTTNDVNLSAEDLMISAFYSWTSEIDAVDNVFSYKHDDDFFNVVVIMWAKVLFLGCAGLRLLNVYQQIFICSYNPAGRVEGQNIYIAGPPASGCLQHSRHFKGLCFLTSEAPVMDDDHDDYVSSTNTMSPHLAILLVSAAIVMADKIINLKRH